MSNESQQKIVDHLNNIIITQSNLAGANLNVDEFMNLVVEEMQRITPATGVVVELAEGNEMVYKAATGSVKHYVGLRLSTQGSISGLCIETKTVLRSDDTENDDRVNVKACRLVGARSLVVTPLLHEGKAVGVLKILSNQPHAFNDNDIQTLQLMAGLIGSALAHQLHHQTVKELLDERTNMIEELKKAEEKLHYMANHDHLTNLPNRNLLTTILSETISRSKLQNKLFAVLFLDMDGFKNVNDTYGHSAGDELLKIFSLRVKQNIRTQDTLARLGGDEFVVVLTDLADLNKSISIAKKIIAKMQEPFLIEATKLHVTTSIGIAFFNNNSLTVEDMLRNADTALYDAKKAGKNKYRIFKGF